jgi:uncharacterized membrane protein YeaQ/YmgE (transglycosylase-associated protein family)
VDAFTALAYIVLGAVLGMVGQGIRVVVGIKKELDQAAPGTPWSTWFQPGQLATTVVISMVVGAIAGVLAVVSAPTFGTTITRRFMVGIIGAGYSGTDFIEGIMTTATAAPNPAPNPRTGG